MYIYIYTYIHVRGLQKASCSLAICINTQAQPYEHLRRKPRCHTRIVADMGIRKLPVCLFLIFG